MFVQAFKMLISLKPSGRLLEKTCVIFYILIYILFCQNLSMNSACWQSWNCKKKQLKRRSKLHSSLRFHFKMKNRNRRIILWCWFISGTRKQFLLLLKSLFWMVMKQFWSKIGLFIRVILFALSINLKFKYLSYLLYFIFIFKIFHLLSFTAYQYGINKHLFIIAMKKF